MNQTYFDFFVINKSFTYSFITLTDASDDSQIPVHPWFMILDVERMSQF